MTTDTSGSDSTIHQSLLIQVVPTATISDSTIYHSVTTDTNGSDSTIHQSLLTQEVPTATISDSTLYQSVTTDKSGSDSNYIRQHTISISHY